MKKLISLSTVACCLTLSSIAQVSQNGLPRFMRWLDNNQVVFNMKRGDDAAPKNYSYNVVTKQYSVAPESCAC
jgi:phage antirepressor YoqD-like protein